MPMPFNECIHTKLVTSVALMMLREEGLFDLDDPLAKYMPQFDGLSVLKPDAQSAEDVVPAQQMVLIRHILSHSAGFSYGFIEPNSVIDQAYLQGGLNVLADSSIDLEEFCDRVARLHWPMNQEQAGYR